MLIVVSNNAVVNAEEVSKPDLAMTRGGGTITLDIPVYIQPKNSDMCGPTCCKMILEHFGVKKRLDNICTEMKNMPDRDYTHIDAVRGMLNRYVPGNHYIKKFVDGNFYSDITSGIDSGYPIVCQLKTTALPAYKGHTYTHYVVTEGYTWAQGGSAGGMMRIHYVDPHYEPEYSVRNYCSFEEMKTAIMDYYGLYVIGK